MDFFRYVFYLSVLLNIRHSTTYFKIDIFKAKKVRIVFQGFKISILLTKHISKSQNGFQFYLNF